MISLTSNSPEVSAKLGAIPPALRAQLRPTFERIGAYLHRYIAQNKITQGGILEPRTGNTRRALFHKVEETKDNIWTRVGVDLAIAPGARIQELGGTITGKKGNLTIPLEGALTAKGVARFSARDVIANPAAFGFLGTFTAKAVIFGKLANHDIVPLFALKRSVTLPARHYLESTLTSQMPWIAQQLADVVSLVLKGQDGPSGEAA